MKNNTRKLSLTIGICAFNEEKGIGNLINQILQQKQASYYIEKIIVVNDVSTDATGHIVSDIAKKYPIVELYNQPQRSGKSAGLNYLFANTFSDMLITLDADIHILSLDTIESLILSQLSTQSDLVFGRVDPLQAESLFGKIIYTYEQFWRYVIDAINNGSNIHRCLGCYMGFTRELYSQLQIPQSIQADDHYIYLYSLSKKLRSVYCSQGGVGYKVPEKFSDYINQFTRYVHSQESIEMYFGEKKVEGVYAIPPRIKLHAYVRTLKEHPVLMSLACVLQGVQKIIITFKTRTASSLWSTISSTK